MSDYYGLMRGLAGNPLGSKKSDLLSPILIQQAVSASRRKHLDMHWKRVSLSKSIKRGGLRERQNFNIIYWSLLHGSFFFNDFVSG